MGNACYCVEDRISVVSETIRVDFLDLKYINADQPWRRRIDSYRAGFN